MSVSIGRSEVTNRKFTYNHLGVLRHLDALPLDNLNVVQTTKNFVLNLELRAHSELGILLDLEGFVLESGFGPRSGQVNGDRVPAGRVHGERENDADTGVVGVGNVLAAAEAE